MADPLEYIVTTAMTHCTQGAGYMPFNSTVNSKVHIQGQLVATSMDKVPMVNIPTYGMCIYTGTPCQPVLEEWEDTYEHVKVNTYNPLIFKSQIGCVKGKPVDAKIKFLTSGQRPLSESLTAETIEAMKDANEKANEAQDDYDLEKQAWVKESGFKEGFIPVWGSGKDYLHSIETHHYWRALGNGLLVVLDVFTLGSDELVIGLVKGGAKGFAEAGAKAIAKKMATLILAKKAVALALEKGAAAIAEFSIKELGICIAKACFVAGTPVATRYGLKHIEELNSGDEVWSHNEETGETALKHVLNVFEQEANVIVELTFDDEIIQTTPEHPFYADGKWMDAGLLEVGNTIQLFNGKAALVQQVSYKFDRELQPAFAEDDEFAMRKELTKVFNIEVEGWHTYFVGNNRLLVHNTVCIRELMESAAKGIAKKWEDLSKFIHCFVAGTKVKTPNGDIPIELIKQGDEVFAYNLAEERVVIRKVPAVFRNSTDNVIEITIADETIRCTSKHRIWEPEDNEWIEAAELAVGKKVLSLYGDEQVIQKIAFFKESTDTYNFEVEEDHNYFVGDTGILVHNDPGPKFPNSIFNDLTERETKIYRYFDPVTKETYYVGKTVQGLETRAGQHAIEKGLQDLVKDDKLAYEVIAQGKWNAFQTAAREQHFIMALESKLQKGMPIWNKINALSKAKFEYFSKLIKCP